MQALVGMATTFHDLWHDHAGIRWLAPFLFAVALVIGTLFVMLVYPHL